MERRLAAILAADVVGYTRLMGLDEAGTLARLTALRSEVLDPLIAAHNGRLVKLTGDGLLVEFSSVVQSLACALAWQAAVAEAGQALGEDERISFRIGINLGDVIVQDDDLYGDGVNIAARLEAAAKPGTICLSGDAYRQVRGKLEVEFEDLGRQVFKNVADPIEVYCARPIKNNTRVAGHGGAAGSRDKPAIAVLPFKNLSGEQEQEYFVDGISEDIITALSRHRWLMVIARSSSFSYKGQIIDLKKVGAELGVPYVLDGSVRRGGRRLRISALTMSGFARIRR